MPAGDAELEGERDRIDHPGAQRRERQREEQDGGNENERKGELPIAAKLGHHGEGEIGVEPHAWRERDRVIGVKPP